MFTIHADSPAFASLASLSQVHMQKECLKDCRVTIEEETATLWKNLQPTGTQENIKLDSEDPTQITSEFLISQTCYQERIATGNEALHPTTMAADGSDDDTDGDVTYCDCTDCDVQSATAAQSALLTTASSGCQTYSRKSVAGTCAPYDGLNVVVSTLATPVNAIKPMIQAYIARVVDAGTIYHNEALTAYEEVSAEPKESNTMFEPSKMGVSMLTAAQHANEEAINGDTGVPTLPVGLNVFINCDDENQADVCIDRNGQYLGISVQQIVVMAKPFRCCSSSERGIADCTGFGSSTINPETGSKVCGYTDRAEFLSTQEVNAVFGMYRFGSKWGVLKAELFVDPEPTDETRILYTEAHAAYAAAAIMRESCSMLVADGMDYAKLAGTCPHLNDGCMDSTKVRVDSRTRSGAARSGPPLSPCGGCPGWSAVLWWWSRWS